MSMRKKIVTKIVKKWLYKHHFSKVKLYNHFIDVSMKRLDFWKRHMKSIKRLMT